MAFALFTAAICWDPIGQRKDGRVTFVERHSTWEPTQRPYDATSYGEDSSYTYAAIYHYASRFYEMSRLLESDAFDAATLDKCDVLVIKVPTSPFSPPEVDAILAFVERGGGLLLIGDHTNVFKSSSYLNQITRPLGFTYRHDLLFSIGSPYYEAFRPGLIPHPAVQHVPPMEFAVTCSIDPGASRGRAAVEGTGLWSLPPNYNSITNFQPEAEYRPEMRYGAFVQVWAMRHGAGRVLAFTDSTIFSNFCTFEPGKAEFMMGMLEWLNHQSPLDRDVPRACVVALLVAAAAASLAFGLRWATRGKGDRHLLCNDHASMVPAEGPSRQKVPVTFSVSRGSVGGIVLLAGAMFGWAVAAASIAAVQRWAMPTPQPARPMVRVVLDRTVSEVPLSRNGFSNPSGKGFALFEQWIPRLGYFTARRSGAEALTGDLLVVVCPTRSPSEQFLGRLAEYVEQGGKLLVIDSPEIENSTANALLWPFGLSIERGISAKGSLKLSSARPAVPVEAACEVEGGEPLLRLGANPVAARVRHGAGQVTAIGFGSVFHDEQMGGNWMTEPDRDLLARFHLLLDLVRSAATGRPLVEPAAPRSGSPGPKSRLLPLPRMPGR